MTDLFSALSFAHGPAMPNRFMLAPLTNQQSLAGGILSDEELNWLVLRAKGGFGTVMTAAAYVSPEGQGYPGQIGIHDDACVPGLTRLAAALKAEGSRTSVQLFHAGIRADQKASGVPLVNPSDDEASGARGLTSDEVEAMIEAFIRGAERAEKAGFDGVELHGAHTYLLCAFLSPDFNRRTDIYGGSLENRARPIRAIIDGIRERCGPDLTLGLRLSAERFGIPLSESRELVRQLLGEGKLDYLDLSLWDVFKTPEDEGYKDRPLISWFTDLPRGKTRLGVAGNVRSSRDAQRCVDAGADFVLIGRAAIANHDFPKRVAQDRGFVMPALPFKRADLAAEGASPPFIDYLQSFRGLVEAD